ncbi:exopolysaccharide Pel transporter PelG [Paenibacillus sp. J5C_2022]|uniref:exopolysaccharide Pel transporter PelG n=1 Tax=Paenibacillus sp. J5C2022 TaxID=2977129 RepID=UPI0021D180BC|nr:exopolysaccharide Pel transporter PelG [Paenibacillus sp. J5C2022]MCU6710802.1 exopolysaccharide Pel transporter PelG [Paenibacillus sp. J5C2022]
MAGIGFELRKLFRKEGLINNVKAYAYSSLTTVGPMILCMGLIMGLQFIMSHDNESYIEWELYVATVAYCFVFSIVFTCGISMVLTRYVADMMYQKKYDRLMSSFYGALFIMLPLGGLVAWLFLRGVAADPLYKLAAYLFFMEMIVIWLQGIYLSALKDYIRIVRGFTIGVAAAMLSGWLLFKYTDLQETTAAILGLDIGFFIIGALSLYHFEEKFPKARSAYFFDFLHYFRKYASLFFAGTFVYSGIYLHNFVYWWGPSGVEVADRFRVLPFYDVATFYAFITVMPTLVTFVVSVETSFYEKLRSYYLNILQGGTIQDIASAKQKMQDTLLREILFMMEVQLLFTVLSLALGLKFLPMIGFTMSQLDLFIILVLSYFMFIMMFVLTHVLMYFDDRKGVVAISGLFVLLNVVCSIGMMKLQYDGLGMFLAAFITIVVVIARLLHVLRNIDYYTFCSQPIHQRKVRRLSFFSKPKATVAVVLVMTLLLSACTTGMGENSGTDSGATEPDSGLTLPDVPVSTRLMEDKRLYERDEDGSLKTLYVTILPDKPGEEPLDWYGLNRIPEDSDRKLDVIVQEGTSDSGAPVSGMFGYGTDKSNATITLRGNTAWTKPQKSYRIKLHDEAGLWLGQRTLNLNKHIDDLTRIRNKLSFDLFESIPNITSLRTQFIHMYVKDLSNGAANANYEDYGLYTHVEQPNKRFLKSHMLDPNGYLYKAKFFEFHRYEESIKPHDDPTYSREAFETKLEIKGREEHGKLIQMLNDVNDKSIPIEEVMEKHFDLDNFLTWTAATMLMDNMDTDAHNFYLYSPLNSDKWYFLPWDYDGGWELQRIRHYIRPYQNGISNYWGTEMHNRYFRNPAHVQQLEDKLEELYANYINEETVTELIDKYMNIVEPFVHRDPDIRYLPDKLEEVKEELRMLKYTPMTSLQRFKEDLEKPKPFYQHEVVQRQGGKMTFGWNISFDLQGDALVYDVMIAKDPLLTDIVLAEKNVKENHLTIDALPRGIYYWRVIARDSNGNEQQSFDFYEDSEAHIYPGMLRLEVE